MPDRWTVAALLGLAALVAAPTAHADLPPPEGQTRVAYRFRVTGAASGAVLVAYPMYNSAGGTVLELKLDQDALTFQGYMPGIYSFSSADAAALTGKDDAAFKDDLAKKGHVCVKAVPRVFSVQSSTLVTAITDVFEVDASATACRAKFKTTLYGGANGEKGEGGVDASGHRTPSAPFGSDLPVVGDMGLGIDGKSTAGGGTASPSAVADASSSVPSHGTDPAPRAGCAGCAVSTARSSATAEWLALGLAGALAWRRPGRRRPRRPV